MPLSAASLVRLWVGKTGPAAIGVTRQVQDRYAGRQGRCTSLETDRYGRTVVRCTVQGQDIGQVLVREGIAFAYRRYSQDYVADEVIAQAADRGIHDFQIQSPAR